MSAPLAIIVGFLGAGKTTFLREVLPLIEARGLKPFVIINDYANARVDASSLRSAGRSVAPVNGSCICCDSISELISLLLDIPDDPRRVVLIEANGTTDPTSLIEHLLVNPDLRQRFAPILQVTVVDAKRWQKRHWHNDLERLQAETASHLLFTREDEVPRKRLAEVHSDLEWVNPAAEPVRHETFARLLEGLVNKDPAAFRCRKSASPRHKHHENHGPHDHHGHQEKHDHHDLHHLAHGFVGLEISLPDPIGAIQLQTWLASFPAGVLRAKGVVRLAEEPDKWFQFQRVDHPQGEAALFALPEKPPVPACAVLIGVRLDADAIQKSLAEALKAPVLPMGSATSPKEKHP